jgi:protein-tyrosine phosphatase
LAKTVKAKNKLGTGLSSQICEQGSPPTLALNQEVSAAKMILEKTGGRQATVKTLYYKMLYWLGAYRRYANPDWSRVNRLVFVCLGNINRSAYGEAKARSLGFDCISYGIDADETKGASTEAIRNGSARGIDLTPHVCRSIYNIELQADDLVLAVEPGHIQAIEQALASNNPGGLPVQLTLLGVWSRSPTPFIQDPICRSDIYFGSCFDRIDQAIYRIGSEIKQAQGAAGGNN